MSWQDNLEEEMNQIRDLREVTAILVVLPSKTTGLPDENWLYFNGEWYRKPPSGFSK